MQRRTLSTALLALAFVCTNFATRVSHAADVGVTDKEIRLGQTVALSGPLAELGKDTAAGAKVYFDYLNAQGGVFGRRINLMTVDDEYKVPKTTEITKRFIETDKVFAIFNSMGTPNMEAILPLVKESGTPFFAPFTGADNVRVPFNRLVFNLRASYGDETEKIVEHLTTVGLKRFAVIYQNNGFGKAGLSGIEKAAQKRGLKIHASTTIENDAADAQKAVDTLRSAQPDSIIMITAGKPSVEFIKRYNAGGRGMQFFTLSVMGTQASVKALGTDGVGVAVAQVVPFPWSPSLPVVKEYQALMTAAGIKEFSFLSLESFINAKAFAEALKRAGKDVTREKLITALEGMSNVSIGGFDVSYGREKRQGSGFVELTIISGNGRFAK